MAWEARSGLKPTRIPYSDFFFSWLNGLGSPFGFETQKVRVANVVRLCG